LLERWQQIVGCGSGDLERRGFVSAQAGEADAFERHVSFAEQQHADFVSSATALTRGGPYWNTSNHCG
jgi:hypothetical protein